MVEGSSNTLNSLKRGWLHDPLPQCSHHILRQHPAILGNLDNESITGIRRTRKLQELRFYIVELRIILPPPAHLASVRFGGVSLERSYLV